MKALLVGAIILFATAPRADEPPPRPEVVEVWSRSRRFVAVMDPAANHTRVFRVDGDGRRSATWSMKGWFRVAALADDGDHFVIGHDGMGLLPVAHRRDEVLLTFTRRGVPLGKVTLRDLLPESSLRKTASHVFWGHYGGIDAAGRYVLDTVEGQRLTFDVRTGRAAEERP
jgi:hypothetical protein